MVPLACSAAVVVFNFEFLRFFAAKRGIWFAAAVLFHQLYYLYSSGAFAWGTLVHKLMRPRQPPSAAPEELARAVGGVPALRAHIAL